MRKIVVLLNNIRSNENVGSIFRTCDATLVSKIILCGYTPTPLDRFGRENKGLTKSSLGAEKWVKWEKVGDLNLAIERLRIEKFKVVAIEQSENSVDYRELKNSKLLASSSHLALIFGNEVDGLSAKDLSLCDLVAEIPMKGHLIQQAHHPRFLKHGKESLNVSVSAGIILYHLISDSVDN